MASLLSLLLSVALGLSQADAQFPSFQSSREVPSFRRLNRVRLQRQKSELSNEVESVNEVEAVAFLPANITEDSAEDVTPVQTFKDLYGFNLAEKTRRDSDALQQILITLTQTEETNKFVQEIVDSNPCVSSFEGFLAFLEQGTKIIEDTAEELEDSLLIIQSIRGEKNMTILTRSAASLLILLDTVYPKMEAFICRVAPEKGLIAMRDLSLTLFKLSEIEGSPLLTFTAPVKENLRWSALVTEAFSNMLDHFQKNIAKIDCYTTTNFFGDFVRLGAETISDMGEVLGALGHFVEAKEVRQYAAFTQSILVSLDKFDNFQFPGDCGPGGLTRVANNLIDLADIISEVGLQGLAIGAGVSFRIDLLP